MLVDGEEGCGGGFGQGLGEASSRLAEPVVMGLISSGGIRLSNSIKVPPVYDAGASIALTAFRDLLLSD